MAGNASTNNNKIKEITTRNVLKCCCCCLYFLFIRRTQREREDDKAMAINNTFHPRSRATMAHCVRVVRRNCTLSLSLSVDRKSTDTTINNFFCFFGCHHCMQVLVWHVKIRCSFPPNREISKQKSPPRCLGEIINLMLSPNRIYSVVLYWKYLFPVAYRVNENWRSLAISRCLHSDVIIIALFGLLPFRQAISRSCAIANSLPISSW